MKNRLSPHLSASSPQIPRRPTTPSELLHAAQKQLIQRQKWIEMYVQQHPAVGIGAALFTGVLVGWIIKRK